MRRDALPALAEHWRQRVLPEWRVIIMDEPPASPTMDGSWAICQVADDYEEIRVHLTDECLDRSVEHVAVTLVHELSHAMLHRLRSTILSVESLVHRDVFAVLDASVDSEIERLVERLARMLVGAAYDNVGPGTFPGPVR